MRGRGILLVVPVLVVGLTSCTTTHDAQPRQDAATRHPSSHPPVAVYRVTAPLLQTHRMRSSPCGSRVWVRVAVKDRATVRAVHRLGRDVLIAGWLGRVR